MSQILTPAAVAAQTGFSEKTLANWRVLGQGPAFFKVGRLVRYRPESVDAWIASQDPQSNVTQIGARRTA